MRFIFVTFILCLVVGCTPLKTSQFAVNKSRYDQKYIDFISQDEEIIKSEYHNVLTRNKNSGFFIERVFFPETKQITKEYTYSDKDFSKPEGICKIWYDNGNLWVEKHYKNGILEGEYKNYHHKTNIIQNTGLYSEGKKIGLWKSFYESGSLREEINYSNNIKEGPFSSYDTLGTLKNSGIYKADTIYHQTNEGKTLVDKMPYFKIENVYTDVTELKKASDIAMLTFVQKNIKYPRFAREEGIEGTAVAQFVINLEGKVTEVEILSGVCQDIRDECYRILSILPDFSPGIQNGKPVNVLFTLPIKFRLD